MGAIKDSAIYTKENQIDSDTYDGGELETVTIITNKKNKNILETLKDFYEKNKNYVYAGLALLGVVLAWKYFKK